jgi:hypothetical protein
MHNSLCTPMDTFSQDKKVSNGTHALIERQWQRRCSLRRSG